MTHPAACAPRRGFCLCCLSASATAGAGSPHAKPSPGAGHRPTDPGRGGRRRHRVDCAAMSPCSRDRGHIAVLTGADGKVLVDAGIAVSRPQVAAALAGWAPSRSRT